MKIVIVDGQGGKLGKLLVEQLKQRCPQGQIYAIGTNSIATATMLKAGADFGATGENPVMRNVMDADVVLGPTGIVVAHAILGEVTPAMAEAIGGCRAPKLLIPMNSCGVWVAGVQELPLSTYVNQIVERVCQMIARTQA
ncbi:MAG: DUF3842 family protein [Oscillospiraceae bacterium]|nr:DUF3842 family protein [Oscillospiraceae bacterium]